MGFFSKLKHGLHGVKSILKKGSAGVESFAKKGASVLHSVNKVADKVAHSKIGNALLSAIPEGHAVYSAVRGASGSLEQGAHTVQSLAKGVNKLASSKDLKTAVSHSKKLYHAGSTAIGHGKDAYRMNRAGIEKSIGNMNRQMRHTNLDDVKRHTKKRIKRYAKKKGKELVSEVATTFGQKRRRKRRSS
jgi:hypothetical protein